MIPFDGRSYSASAGRSGKLRNFVVALILIWPAMSRGSDIVVPAFSLDVGFSVRHFDYREYKGNGQRFNRDSGYIPGVLLTLGRPTGSWDILSKFSYHNANIGYVGATQAGTPITTSAGETLRDLSFQLGRWVVLTPKIAPVRLYAELGYRDWERDIRSTPIATGPVETYRWHYASAGAALPIIQASWGNVAFDARITRTFNSSIDVNSRGLYETANVTLGDRNGFRVSLPISLPLRQGLQLHIDPSLEEWSFGRSNTVNLTQHGSVVGTIFEPRSETRTIGIVVSLEKIF